MKLNCHCGAVEAEINASINELAKIVRCNCSICKRKNATMGMVKNENFKVTKGKDKLKLYQYHTKVANHYFCAECGIYTHHNPWIMMSINSTFSTKIMISNFCVILIKF